MPTHGYISSLDPNRAPAFPRKLCVLGSTGSIGVNGLAVAAEHPERFQIAALAGARNAALLAEQADRWRPRFLAVLNQSVADQLARSLPVGYAPEILVGPEGYQTLASLPEVDVVLSAQVGAAGLGPTMAAVRAGKLVALANKESLVLAGDLIRDACRESGALLLPVDSEHNAMFQALAGGDIRQVRRFILTASGGPFRGRDRNFLAGVTPEAALAHPNWSMGAKISIDSATLMNKGLEVIEACRLFGVEASRIQVVVHPQSIVHSLVEHHDGSVLAHLGTPDMRTPISYCMSWPERPSVSVEPLDLIACGQLTFEAPDLETFPCLSMAMRALEAGGGAPVVLNAANEVAVHAFLDAAIGFLDIPALVGRALDEHLAIGLAGPLTMEAILEIDAQTRRAAERWIGRL